MLMTRHKNNPNKIKHTALHWALRHSFLFLLSFAFLAQQAFAYSSYSSFSQEKVDKYSSLSSFGQHHALWLEEVQSQLYFNAIEMELDEDEDFSNASKAFKTVYYSGNSAVEFHICSLVKTRYLHLLSCLQQQPEKPLYILHHSWMYSIS